MSFPNVFACLSADRSGIHSKNRIPDRDLSADRQAFGDDSFERVKREKFHNDYGVHFSGRRMPLAILRREK